MYATWLPEIRLLYEYNYHVKHAFFIPHVTDRKGTEAKKDMRAGSFYYLEATT